MIFELEADTLVNEIINSNSNSTNNINGDYTPDYFKKVVDQIQDSFPSLLDEFQKYFIFHSKNPEYPEYANIFLSVKKKLSGLTSKIYEINAQIQNNMMTMNNSMSSFNDNINNVKNANIDFKKKLGKVRNTNNGSTELIDNYKEMYRLQYLRNVSMFVGIFIAIAIVIKNKRASSL